MHLVQFEWNLVCKFSIDSRLYMSILHYPRKCSLYYRSTTIDIYDNITVLTTVNILPYVAMLVADNIPSCWLRFLFRGMHSLRKMLFCKSLWSSLIFLVTWHFIHNLSIKSILNFKWSTFWPKNFLYVLYICSIYVLYTEYNWKVRRNFGHEFQTPKHLIYELQLKEYIYNKCSKCLPWDSVHTSTYEGLQHPFKDAGVVADSLTGIHNVMMKCLFVVNRSWIHKGF
jgi:hypothetical protein